MRIANEDLLLVDGVRSVKNMASSFTIRPLYLGHICNFAVQLVFTGSPVGSFKLQCSNDPGRPFLPGESAAYADVVNWTDISGSTQAISAAGNHTWQVENAGYLWLRVVYTATSGSGSLDIARANVKGV